MSKSITITINPPSTEWCSDCGSEFHYSNHSMRAKCQACGSQSMHYGIRPIHSDVVGFYKSTGRFNLLSNDEQFQYVFTNINVDGFKNRISFVVDDDLDCDCPFDLADELNAIYDRHWISSDKEKIKDLAEVVFNEEFRDSQFEKRKENNKQKLLAELYWLEC